ncbi:hypothetical protein LTS08_006574 [Lithohypha guttulata]|nr:hypothetical protein LTS08_006574 [Lithohypha guttulata]
MALKFLSAHTGTGGTSSSVKLYEIRLDSDYIVLRGTEDEAGSARLSGQLVLSLVDSLTITGVKLTLSGIVHMSYATTSASSLSGRRNASKEQTFYQKSWTFRECPKGKSETLPSDNYTWPFDVVLDGALPESVEGLKDAYVVYRLKAEVTRKRGKDLVIRKPLRIVRTLGPSALELSHAMSVENIWPNKVEYSISTPSKAVIFGSFLQVDFKLIPLLKGLVIGNISTQLKEEHEFCIDPEWNVLALNGGQIKDDRVIAYDNYKLNPDHDLEIIEEAAEGFQFSRYLELPKTLSKCLQDCNVKGIKVRHKIKFNVQLHNPDGHISELRANLPVSLYISESLPLNDDNDLVDQTPQAGRAALQNDIMNSAPPVYGEHQFDQPFSDMDPSGWRTPGGALSAVGTPYAHSRNISSENLASMDAVADAPGHVSATALQHRLQDLRRSDTIVPTIARIEHDQFTNGNMSRRGSGVHINGDYVTNMDAREAGSLPRDGDTSRGTTSGLNSVPDSNDVSRRTSNEDVPHSYSSGTATPFFQTDHFEDLAKVPSYSTAIRTPAPRSHHSGSDLPSYGACMAGSGPAPPALPASAHVRDVHRMDTYPPASYSSSAPTNRNLSHLQDEERRLRVMQLRGRT